MKTIKEFQKFIPHMQEIITITYLGKGGKVFVPKNNVGVDGPFEIRMKAY